jgi:hypothetical protein
VVTSSPTVILSSRHLMNSSAERAVIEVLSNIQYGS